MPRRTAPEPRGDEIFRATDDDSSLALDPGVCVQWPVGIARDADADAGLLAPTRQQHLSGERLRETRSGARDHAAHPLDGPCHALWGELALEPRAVPGTGQAVEQSAQPPERLLAEAIGYLA